MPDYLLSWWNVQNKADQKVASDALTMLADWNGPLDGADGSLVDAKHSIVTCEVQAGNTSYELDRIWGFADGRSPVADCPKPGDGSWLAVRHREKQAQQRKQLGYYGIRPGSSVSRIDKGAGPSNQAWPEGSPRPWTLYPEVVTNLTPPPRVYSRAGARTGEPTSYGPREYPARREIIEEIHAGSPEVRAYWYHALSGGSHATAFDVLDAFALMMANGANAARMGIATVAILIGDLNLDPVQIRGVISDHRQAPMGEDDEPRPKRRRVSSYVVLGPSREATIGTDTVQILATSRPTHRRGGRLDCAIVAYFGVPDARPVWAGVDVPVAPMPVGESVPIRDRQGNQTGRSDHYPIRLLLRT